MAFFRFNRDKRGYEHFYLVEPIANRRGKSRPRVLYWYRTPPNIRVGRVPFDPEVQRALEAQNPNVVFDWRKIIDAPIPSADVEKWRERRRAERAEKAARRAAAAADASADAAMAAVAPVEDDAAEIDAADGVDGLDADGDEIENADGSTPSDLALESGAPMGESAAESTSTASAIADAGTVRTRRRRRRRRGRRPDSTVATSATAHEPSTATSPVTESPNEPAPVSRPVEPAGD